MSWLPSRTPTAAPSLGVDDSGAVAGIPRARLDAVERWIADAFFEPLSEEELKLWEGG